MTAWVLEKDPEAVLDYPLDLAAATNGTGAEDWLESGETVSAHTVTVPSGLTLDSSNVTNSGTTIVAWISGGTAGSSYDVNYEWTTTGGRTDQRTRTIDVIQR